MPANLTEDEILDQLLNDSDVAPSVTPEDEALDRIFADEDARVSTSLDVASRQDPNQAAEALSLGFDVETAPEVLTEAKRRRAQVRVPRSSIQASPTLFRFFSDPTRASAAFDDVPTLSRIANALNPEPERAIEGAARVFSARTQRGQAMIERADAGYALIFDDSQETLLEFQQRDASLRSIEVPEGGALVEFAAPAVEQFPVLAEQLGAAGVGAAVGAVTGAGIAAVTGQFGPQVVAPEEILTVPAAAATGASIGGRSGAALRIFKIEAGNAMAEFRELTDDTGAPIDPSAAKGAALAVGAINASLEFASLAFLLRRLPGGQRILDAGSKSGARRAMLEALRVNGAMRRTMLRFGRDYLAAVGVETSTEIAQATVQTVAENILDSTLGTGDRILPSAEQREEIGAEGFEAFKATIVIGGAGATVRAGTEVATATRRAKKEAETLAAIEREAKVSQLLQRSSDTFEELVNDLGLDADIESVYVPAKRLREFADAGLIDLTELTPGVQRRIAEAELLGGDAAVPIGEYLTRIPEALRAQMSDQVKLAVDGLSPGEADALQRVLERELAQPEEAEAEAVAPEVPSVLSVLEDVGDTDVEALTDAQKKVAAEALSIDTQRQQIQRDAATATAKTRRKRMDDERPRVTAEVESELAASASWRARNWLAKGELTQIEDLENLSGLQHRKLDRGELLDRYGVDLVSQMPQNTIARDGVAPDLIAELFGFDHTDDMVIGLIESKGSLRQAVKAEVDTRLADLVGQDESVPATVDQARAEDALADLLVLEEKILAQRSGQAPIARSVLRAAAVRLVSTRHVAELRPGAFRVTASRKAAESINAAQSGDLNEAVVAKRQEMLNRFMDREARKQRSKASSDIKAVRKFLDKKTRERVGKAGGTFLEQIDALLDRFELRLSLRKLERKQGLADWIAEQEAEGESVIVPESIRAEAEGLALKTHWRNLTPGQIADLRDSVENIAHLASLKTDLRVRNQKRQLEEIEGELVEEAEQSITRKANRSSRVTPRLSDIVRSGGRQFDASLSQTEFVIDALGGAPNSAWRQAVLEPVLDARDDFSNLWEAFGIRLSDMMEQFDKKTKRSYRRIVRESRLKDTDGRSLQLTKWNLMMAALNTGNVSNRGKLVRGYGWDDATLLEVLDQHLTKADWDWVQSVWDLVGELWPRVAELERRVTGVVPPKVKSAPVETKHGTFRGGYFPVVYDPTRSQIAERNQLADLFANQPNGVARATTGHGHTQARTNVARPILLETSVISKHLHEVILDLTYREPLMNVQRVLSRPGVDQALKDALGPEFSFRQFWLPWLQSIAGDAPNPTPVAIWNRAIRSARLNATVFKLGFRATTLLIQPSAHSNAIRVLREAAPNSSNREVAQHWARAIFRSLEDIGRGDVLAKSVLESSTFMRTRVKSFDRDARDVVNRAQAEHGFTNDLRDFAMNLIGNVQLRFVDVPVWSAAKNLAVENLGMRELDARRFADAAVRKSQGAGDVLSQSAVQRRSEEFFRAMTMFYSYNNTNYNQIRSSGRGITVKSVPSFLAAYLFYAVIPGLYAEAMRTLVREVEGRDEEVTPERAMAKIVDVLFGDMASTIPLLRDVWGSVIAFIDPSQGFRAEPSGALPITQDEINALARAVRSGEADRTMIAALRAAALLKGLPADYFLRLADRAAKDN